MTKSKLNEEQLEFLTNILNLVITGELNKTKAKELLAFVGILERKGTWSATSVSDKLLRTLGENQTYLIKGE